MLCKSRREEIMIPYLEALSMIRELRKPLKESEQVPLNQALNRISFQDCFSPCLLPPFDNSAMDGFALKSRETQEATTAHPIRFPVIGSLAAGDLPPLESSQKGVWEIMTGAALPFEFDS